MKLAFNNKAHYTDFSDGYALYKLRTKKGMIVDEALYRRVIKSYCRVLAKRLETEGAADFPNDMGTVAAVSITRKPQYRGKVFIGYGMKDWTTGMFDGKLRTFGIAYLPKRKKNKQILRCLGFVANRQLFQRMKNLYLTDTCPWALLEFNDDMI